MTVRFTHAEFEASHPKYVEHERLMQDARAARGLPASREFPCKGLLVVDSEMGDNEVLWCDACGFCVVVPKRQPVRGSQW